MIKAIIFDIGGVLARDVWESLFLDEDGIALTYNLDLNKVQAVGKELWEQFAYLSAKKEKSCDALEIEYWRLFTEKMHISVPIDTLINITDRYVNSIPGMIPLLDSLQSEGLELAICSNNTEFWFRRQADKLKLYRFFEPQKIILSCNIGVPKRSEDLTMFQAVVDALTANKDECIFVDDREENIEKALRFGITSIFFPSHQVFGSEYLHKIFKSMKILP